MRSSMRRKLLGAMFGLVAFVVVFGFLFNSLFLERFYLYYKRNTLLRTVSAINQLYNSDSQNIDVELLRLQMEQGIQVIVFGSNLDVRFMTMQSPLNIAYSFRSSMGSLDLLGFVRRNYGNESLTYEISRNYDERLRMENLDLVGALDNGNYVLLRMPIQTITDSVGVANRFLLMTGAISLLVSVIISVSLSKQIARPIREVEDIAGSMSNLDFSRRITVRSRDEIGSLASSINTLSDQLQGTIQELRSKNDQLEEDIRYISRMDERRKEFLSSVSHELKTPIALIQGYAEALEERVVTSDENRSFYYHVISDEADKMNTLVKKLMSLDNLEAGQDELYMEYFDIVALAQSVVRRGKSLSGAEGLDFLVAAPEEAQVRADEFLIEEVVFNYITNAIHYAQGRNLVRVTVREVSEEADPVGTGVNPGGMGMVPPVSDAATADYHPAPDAGAASGRRVRVEVFNSGDHLGEEERERVWESFYKADKSRSREYGGSGLGLSVVRAVMERHQSAYGVENVEDGVCFWFELPAGESDGA